MTEHGSDLLTRRQVATAFFVLSFCVAGSVPVRAQPPATTATWDGLKADIFGDRTIEAADGIVTIDAPARAEDAAIVPIDLHFAGRAGTAALKAVTLVIDENPSPVAATFTFGKEAGVTHLATRVRVDSYSYVRAIAETEDGKLYMTQAFVKASGGCGAPASKNQDEAMASLGKMKLRIFPPQSGGADFSKAADVQLMIRHPNNSGLQMDQITRYYIPAHFVHDLTISQGDRLILKMEGGISISEDPNFRFQFAAKPGEEIKVEATDTEGQVFKGHWPLDPA
ncbi:MAG: quinoprotein dehydrogenase-associated SoxYZ-like carrier [Rhizobiaceae bacterium]|nr:quinoprotein dehydrogenase-associated SoxYZ-like carrier [Rhizobiaceae bacterium]